MAELAPRLKELTQGGYKRAYRHHGQLLKTSLHVLVAELLDSLNVPYREDVPVPNSGSTIADFMVNGRWVFINGPSPRELARKLGKNLRRCVFIRREALRSDSLDHGIRVLSLEESGDLQTIFLDDPSFNFDYAHILPRSEKCSVMHGHTSSVLLEVVGRPIDGMVVDFGVAKELVRSAIRSLDHKMFINERYVMKVDSKSVTLKFRTVHGDFVIKAPKLTTVLMPGEATVENLAREVITRIAPGMPANVNAVGAYVYEGLNKGSHILAQIHQDGKASRREQ